MTVGVAIVGMGVMGRTHLDAFRQADALGARCRVVGYHTEGEAASAALNIPAANDGTNGSGAAEAPPLRRYASLDELASDMDSQLVVVCTPTTTHVPIASALLRAGKHVLVEKPVALTSADVESLAAKADRAGRLCVPAMCVRFWPGWDWLKARVSDGAFGRILGASLTRIGSRPGWSREFYLDAAQSGGALFDLHIHDADILHWLLGPPRSIIATGDRWSLSSLWRYGENGPRISIEGGWIADSGFDFRMRYTVRFERAVADWDLSRPVATRLQLTQYGTTTPITIAEGAGYVPQAAAIVRAVVARGPAPVTLAEAAEATRTLEATARSLDERREVIR